MVVDRVAGCFKFAAVRFHGSDPALGRLCVVLAVLYVSERAEGMLQ
jgi:hypothetical protein